MLLEFCDERELCVASTWFKKTDKRKLRFISGNNESEIDFILASKKKQKIFKDLKVIPWELQHLPLVADVDKRKLNEVVKKESRVLLQFGETRVKLNASLPVSFRLFRTVQTVDKTQRRLS